ncbi:DsbA family oxidoreductase [Nafulsella turpanensis]|uniref:DsbA family oxidoreductase n=1 Tax=Nafulsella turpanensis TaxID=1265690 RepID=UPI00034CF5E1|nr:DsbA family oxidoreductase [Nafulsella turpanensis]
MKIKIYSDYVCPFCYLGEQQLKEVLAEEPGLKVETEWMPFELRPFPTPTLKPEDEYLPRVWESSVYPMAEDIGVKIKLPTISPQPYTHLAFEGYQFAKEQGKGEAYTHRLFEAFFKEDKDIGDMEVLSELAREVGLEPQAYRQAVESRKYKEQHRQALQEAQRNGIRAVPTFQIGNRLYQGVIPKAQLRRILQEAAQE